MALLTCPDCGFENPLEAEVCSVCQASLVDLIEDEAEQPEPSEQPEPTEQAEQTERTEQAEPTEQTEPDDPSEPSDPDELELLPQDDEDLPGLLHSLKQDEDLEDFAPEDGEAIDPSTPVMGAVNDQDDLEDEPGLPDWLHRIRERAQSEPDSVGDITQRIKAARESLDEENQETQHQQYESVIKNIQGEDEEQPFKEQPLEEEPKEEPTDDKKDEETQGDADWLSKIRKKFKPDTVEALEPELDREKLFSRDGDSLLQWLIALEEDEDGTDEGERSEVPDEDTQEVAVSPAAGDSTQKISTGGVTATEDKGPSLVINPEEQARADQLAATVLNERAPRSPRQRLPGFSPRGTGSAKLRLLMGVLLVAVLSFALFLPAPVDLPPAAQGPHSLAVIEWSHSLPEEASLLLVLDYQAGYAAELDMISKPVLDKLFLEGRDVSILVSSPSGGLLFDRFLAQAELADRLVVNDLGYYPIESFGAYGLASHILSEWRFISQPEFSKTLPAGPLDGVLILADEYEGAMAWIEQISSLVPDTPIYLLVTAQAVPLLMPYWESGQVMGIAGGMPDAVNLADETTPLTSRWRAYQAGVLLVIVLLLVGITFPMHTDTDDEGGDNQSYRTLHRQDGPQ